MFKLRRNCKSVSNGLVNLVDVPTKTEVVNVPRVRMKDVHVCSFLTELWPDVFIKHISSIDCLVDPFFYLNYYVCEFPKLNYNQMFIKTQLIYYLFSWSLFLPEWVCNWTMTKCFIETHLNYQLFSWSLFLPEISRLWVS